MNRCRVYLNKSFKILITTTFVSSNNERTKQASKEFDIIIYKIKARAGPKKDAYDDME